MKSVKPAGHIHFGKVTPYVGVWIEMFISIHQSVARGVTPYVGVWIEIAIGHIAAAHTSSPPMWGCGLKYDSTSICLVVLTVTPYVGVWIEI